MTETAYATLAERALGISPPFTNPGDMASQAYAWLTGERTGVPALLARTKESRDRLKLRGQAVGTSRALYELMPSDMETYVSLNALNHILAAYGTVLGALPPIP